MSTTTIIARACACGGVLRARVAGNGGDAALNILSVWERVHSAPGCAPASVKDAGRARRKAERESDS